MRKMKTHREPGLALRCVPKHSAGSIARQHAPSALISAYWLSHLSVRAFSRLRTRFTTAPPLDSSLNMAPAAPSSTGRSFLWEGDDLTRGTGNE